MLIAGTLIAAIWIAFKLTKISLKLWLLSVLLRGAVGSAVAGE